MAFKFNPFTGTFDVDKDIVGAITSVSTTDPSLRVSPTTGAVIIYAFNPMFYSYYGGF